MGVYGQKDGGDDCTSCDKRGDPRPCNGWEEGDNKDFIDLSKFATCGYKSACCNPGPPILEDGTPDPEWKCSCKTPGECNCCCEELSKCECDERKGHWIWPKEEQLEEGETYSCSDVCKDPITGKTGEYCHERCCTGEWRLVEGPGTDVTSTFGGGTYCNGCYEGLAKWMYVGCFPYDGYVRLEKKVCTDADEWDVVARWTTKCGRPKIDTTSFACPDAPDGDEPPDCSDCE
jgi:hypothetical protein